MIKEILVVGIYGAVCALMLYLCVSYAIRDFWKRHGQFLKRFYERFHG